MFNVFHICFVQMLTIDIVVIACQLQINQYYDAAHIMYM